MLGPGVEPRKTDYDREAAAARIRALDWTDAEQFASQNVLTVPTTEQGMEFFSRVEAKQRAT
jgi:hypothetical protein